MLIIMLDPFKNWTIDRWDIQKLGAKLLTCLEMHCRTSDAILMSGCTASQHVAGPIDGRTPNIES